MNSTLYWLWLSACFGTANHRIWELYHDYSDVSLFYDDLVSFKVNGLTEKEVHDIKTTHTDIILKLIEHCLSRNIKIVCYDDDEYPQRLRNIYNPPCILFCMGNLDFIDDSISIAVVGARDPSEYSVRVATEICNNLAVLDTVLISGFAYGIDSIAHKSALVNNTRTVAVLGCGIDYDYPKENAKLKQVIAKNGAVISECFPGAKPLGDNFRQRNRIISGLSLGVLVVEASSKSGSLNTVMHGLQQGKDIFCIPPHDIFSEKYAGVVKLLRDGAIPVFSYLDLMYEYFENYSHKIKGDSLFNSFYLGTNESSGINSKENNKIDIKRQKTNVTHHTQFDKDYSDLDEQSVMVLKALDENDMQLDELAVLLDIEISTLLILLTDLEISGYISSLAGKRYTLK